MSVRAWFTSLVLAALALPVRPVGPAAAPVAAEWAAKWRADLALVADTLPKIHPNLYHSVPAPEFRAAIEALSGRVPELSHDEIVVELARVVARVHDGHTRLTFPFDSAAGFFTGHSPTPRTNIPGLVFRHLPVRYGLFSEGLFIVRADSAHRDLLGARVVAIGSLPTDSAMAAVAPAIQRDNDAQVADLTPTWLVVPEILHACRVTADPESTRLAVVAGGAAREAVLAPVPAGQGVTWADLPRTGDTPWRERHPERRHWFEPLPGTRTVYARYREVMDDERESVAGFARALFGYLGAHDVDRLVLDIRGNPGGDGHLNEPLLQGIIRERRLWAPGGLFVLTDGGTFSAAVMLAADLETHTPAVFVGGKTGGAPNGYGDSRKLTLPNSGITIRTSTLYWQLTDPRDDRDGFLPLLPTPASFEDFRAGRDPALDAVLAWSAGAANPEGRWTGAVEVRHQRAAFTVTIAPEGKGWGARLDSEDFEAKAQPLASVAWADGVFRGEWTSGPTWRLAARPGGDLMFGTLSAEGSTYPVVLRREPR